MRLYPLSLLCIISCLFSTEALLAQVQIGNTIKGGQPYEATGSAIDLSEDGRRVLISAIRFTPEDGPPSAGKIYVMEERNGQWEQVGDAILGESIYRVFSNFLQISDDGKRIAASGFQSANSATFGSVQVLAENNGEWLPVGGRIAGMEEADEIKTIALSGDGRRLAVATITSMGGFTGKVRMYEEVAGEWVRIGAELFGREIGWRNGASLALSKDGKHLVVGASGANRDGMTQAGAVRVYEDKGGYWSKLGSTFYGKASYSGLGQAVAISEDGYTIALGARGLSQDAGQGQVNVYRWQGKHWESIGEPIRADNGISGYGERVALADAGNRLVVMGLLRMRILENINDAWKIIVDLPIPQSSNSLGLSANGLRFAYGNPGLNLSEGEVKVYGLGPISNTSTPKALSPQITLYPNPTNNQVYLSGPLPSNAFVQLYNSTGSLMPHSPVLQTLSEDKHLVELSAYPAGLYLLQVAESVYRIYKQ